MPGENVHVICVHNGLRFDCTHGAVYAKDCSYNNAVAESTFKMIKAELVSCRRFDSLYQLQLELAGYVHWFNNIRLHGSLGYLSPAEFKKTCTL